MRSAHITQICSRFSLEATWGGRLSVKCSVFILPLERLCVSLCVRYVVETLACPLFLNGVTQLGFRSLPYPAVDPPGTHFTSLNLSLLICEVRGWGWLIAQVFFHLKSLRLWLLPFPHQQPALSEVC